MENRKDYWFPAKTHGCGWSLPNTWQGWAVLASYLAGVMAPVVYIPRKEHPVEFFAVIVSLTVALLVVFWFKGEPLKWRWGRK